MYKAPHQKSKNTFIVSQKKVAALDDTSAFPDLVTKTSITEVEKPQLDFKAKLETAQVIEIKKPPPVIKKKNRGATPDEIMGKLVENYERWKAEYIEEYGEDYYERYYRFQDYDYEYFDKLDEKLERDLELEEEEERKRQEEAEYVTESYEEYEKE
jgi:hypothetical protein